MRRAAEIVGRILLSVIIQGFVCDAPAWHEFEIEDDTDDN